MTRIQPPFCIALLAFLAATNAAFTAHAASGSAPVLPDISKAPLVADPMLGRLQVFDDWAVACDNRLSCSAVSLTPDNAGEPSSVLVSIRRDSGPAAPVELRVIAADQLRGRIDFVVDGIMRARKPAASDVIEFANEPALDLIRTLGSSYAFELRDRRRQVIGSPSLQGLPAALRYMDERQGRVGSSAALAAIGDGPADMGRPAPPAPLPLHDFPPLAAAPPPALTDAEQATARRLAMCESEVESSHPLEVHTLDAEHVLVLLPCDAGAYNVSAVPLVAVGGAGNWQFRVALFDHVPGYTGDANAPPLIVNAHWNPVRGELSSFAKGRGLGDCGTAETYRWDGSRFRLTEARSMPVCRGAWEWPVIYSLSRLG